METLQKGNRIYEVTKNKWSNGDPVLILIGTTDYDEAVADYDEEESYTCPSTGLRMSLTGDPLEDN